MVDLPTNLVKEFVKSTYDKKDTKTTSRFYGTADVRSDGIYVLLDGSTTPTPVSMVTDAQTGDRVLVEIVDHSARIIQNLDKSNSDIVADRIENDETGVFKELRVGKEYVDTLIANDITADSIVADSAKIKNLETDNITINETLIAHDADIQNLEADNVTINEKLTAHDVDIQNLEADNVTINEKLTAHDADIQNLEADNVTINEKLIAHDADIENLEADNVTINETLTAHDADIQNLEADKLSAKDIEGKYANIDFSNIGKAAMEYFYSQSGLIENVVVGDATITGRIVGVTISGDRIEANTIKADKLVVKGSDGLYYKLNIEGGSTVTEQLTEEMLQNGLDGNNIIANTITAEKIAVDDLIAFDATIGGFNIGENSIYSGVKETVDNTTRGIYFDTDGQMNIGDASNFIKYYKDTDGNYRLEISAKSVKFGISGTNLEEELETIKDEVTTNLRIESSRGTVFKNDNVSTVLSAVIYRGSQRITDMATLKSVMGSSAYLQWKWQRLDEESYGIISASDSRFSNDGFTFTLSPDDVDTKVTFLCELIV